MGLGLKALNSIAASEVVERLGLRKPASRLVYQATRNGSKAAGNAGRFFHVPVVEGEAPEIHLTAVKDGSNDDCVSVGIQSHEGGWFRDVLHEGAVVKVPLRVGR